MTLLVDVGNTAVKWRLQSGAQVIARGELTHDRDWTGVMRSLTDACPLRPDVAWIASVAGADGDALIAQELQRSWSLVPRFYYSEASSCGVVNGYQEPRRLGVDRWLAAIEGWHSAAGDVIIIDCGTAITLDGVTSSGRHLGGYIAPGYELLYRSLLRGTADLCVSAARPARSVGENTSQAVENGILLMAVGFIREALIELQTLLSDTCVIILTGGGADAIASHLPASLNVEKVPDLVLDGLDRVSRSFAQKD